MARTRNGRVASVVGGDEPPVAPAPAYPEQDLGFNPWPIVADPAVAVEEIEAGVHDARLALLAHVAASHGHASIRAACLARTAILQGA